jgi:hypothetical protein
MEVLALAALLGVGYVLTKGPAEPSGVESFINEAAAPAPRDAAGQPDGFSREFPYGGQPPDLYPQERTPHGPRVATIPGKPRQPSYGPDGELDQYYQLPTGGSLPSNPIEQPDLYPRNQLFSTPLPSQAPQTAVTSQVRMNVPGHEEPPVYNSGKTVISPLTGLPMSPDEFTHNNMVPFFRGSVKQNMTDDANRSKLDNMIGTGFNQIEKREQAPLFDPHREPTGNITGLENITDFFQDRVVVNSNRAFEKPMESTRVGPGVSQGFSSLPIGGFQQFEVMEVAKRNLSIDELRVASNPRITYEGVVIAGKTIGAQRGEIGEVRKYHPDKFFMNEHGERNFVTTSENSRPTTRSDQVIKFQARSETSSEFMGPAAASDFSATYTVPSFKAPFARQQDGYGYRNADGSSYGTSDTDAQNNDYGASSIEMLANQRNVTSERGQALNLVTAGVPGALTVYDPDDVARTTVRETTGANDWIGGAVGVAALKLTVYDPSDITRITHRNTNAEVDTALNVTRAGVGSMRTLQFPDGWRNTSKEAISANSAYTGSAGQARAKGEQVYDGAYAMRQNGMKELTSVGRQPEYGNGIKPLFNGEDNVNLSYRKITSDVLNDRDNTVNRVVGPAAGTEAIGLQRPKQILRLDIAKDRNIHDILDTLDDNPYALPLFKIAQQPGLPASREFGGFPHADTDLRQFTGRSAPASALRVQGPFEMGLAR